MTELVRTPLRPKGNRRLVLFAEIFALAALIPLAIYLWVAPLWAERALAKASLSELTAIAARQPENRRVPYYLGLRYREKGEKDRAVQFFADAAKRNPDDEKSWLAWANAAEALSRDEDAFQILTAFSSNHPQSAPAHYALALLYQKNQAHKRALEEARAAVKCDPQNADSWRLTGEEALQWKRLDEAETALRRAVALRPDDWRNQLGLGHVLVERKLDADAANAYREATRLAPQEPLPHLCLGRALLNVATTTPERDAARQSLLRAVELRSDIALAHLLLGQSYVKDKRWTEARTALEQAKRLAPNDADAAFALIAVYRQAGDETRATQEVQRHQRLYGYAQQKYALISRIQENPENDAARLEVARLSRDFGDFADARYFYRSLLSRKPDLDSAKQELAQLEESGTFAAPGTLVLAADSLRQGGDGEAAKKMYLAALRKDAKCAPAYQGIGLILDAQGRSEEAYRFLAYAARLNPRLPEAQYVLAQRYREVGFPQEAARRMNLILPDAPNNAAYWYELGKDYGDADGVKSEQAFQKAVQLEPKNAAYLLDLADRQNDNGRTAEAEANCRRALTLTPDNSDALSRLAGVLLNANPTEARRQEAERLLQRAVALEPHNEFAVYSLGRLELLRGETKRAIAHFERVAAAHPDIAEVWYSLSRAYLRLGDRTRSAQAGEKSRQLHQDYQDRVHTEELIRRDPENPTLHRNLARLCARKGESAKAILQYRLCLKQNPKDATARRELDELTAFLKAKGKMPSMNLFNTMVGDMAKHGK